MAAKVGRFFLRCSVLRAGSRHIPPSDVCPRVAAMACLVRHQRLSTEPLPKPPSDIAPRAYPEKLHSLVDDISRLTLTEVAQLNELLKSTLNIPDMPVMVAGAPSVSPAAPQAAAEPEEEQRKFTVKLVNFSSDSKVKLIKEVKVLMEGMNLVQAKKFVEGVPQVVKENLSKEEAQKLQTTLEAAGGSVQLE